ncbi:MAG: hypothetical protein AB8B94_08510 [Hyphomicrobiales bacterium]
MDIPKIIQSMKQSGVDDHSAETLGFAISSMADKGIDPYLIAMSCAQAGSAIIIKTLPDEDLLAFGKFLQRSGKTKIEGALTKMSINTNKINENSTSQD